MTTAAADGEPAQRVDPRVAHTRSLVYRATLELIAQDGVSQATVERIADHSGVARSTIYRRWPSLAQLYCEAFAQIARRSIPPARGDTAAELMAYLEDYAERLNDHWYCSVLLALLDAAWRDPRLAEVRKAVFDERSSRAAAILAVGVRVGTIRADADIAEAMDAIIAPLLYRRLVEQQPIGRRDVQRVHGDVLTRFGTSVARNGAAGS